MKKILKITALSAILLSLVGTIVSCDKDKENPCIIDRPKDLKLIDWGNYNDVYTVYWTYYNREAGTESWVYEDTTKILKIYGWIIQNHEWDEHNYNGLADFIFVDSQDGELPHVPFVAVGDSDVVDSIKTKLSIADPTKKWYAQGKLSFPTALCIDGADFGCCLLVPVIKIYRVDDIYFE